MILDDKPLDRYTLNIISDFLVSEEFKSIVNLTDDLEKGINLCHTVIKNLANQGTLRDMLGVCNEQRRI